MLTSNEPEGILLFEVCSAGCCIERKTFLLTRRVGIAMGCHAARKVAPGTILGVRAQGGAEGKAAYYVIRFRDAAWGAASSVEELALPELLALPGLECFVLLLIFG